MMQTDNAHLPWERSFNGKAIDIKGCISAEGRHMWENLRQRPVDLLLPTRTPHFFPRTRRYIPIKERVLSEIESDCSGKDLWRRLRDTEESYWRIRRRVWIIGCWNNCTFREREKKSGDRKSEHYKILIWSGDIFIDKIESKTSF